MFDGKQITNEIIIKLSMIIGISLFIINFLITDKIKENFGTCHNGNKTNTKGTKIYGAKCKSSCDCMGSCCANGKHGSTKEKCIPYSRSGGVCMINFIDLLIIF